FELNSENIPMDIFEEFLLRLDKYLESEEAQQIWLNPWKIFHKVIDKWKCLCGKDVRGVSYCNGDYATCPVRRTGKSYGKYSPVALCRFMSIESFFEHTNNGAGGSRFGDIDSMKNAINRGIYKPIFQIRGSREFSWACKKADIDKLVSLSSSNKSYLIKDNLGLSDLPNEEIVMIKYPRNTSIHKMSKPTVMEGVCAPFRVHTSSDSWGKAMSLTRIQESLDETVHCQLTTNDDFSYDIWGPPGRIDTDFTTFAVTCIDSARDHEKTQV
ncbi:MAG TPA: hypothetical protein VF810_04750, partial [Patescibacteria group bacterium]